METNILNLFDKIYLINLKRRPDRLAEFYENNYAIVKNLDIEIFEAYDGKLVYDNDWNFSKGALGCYKSHIELLKKIRASNHQKVLILEDDAVIVDEEILKNKEVERFFITQKWDMFYFGFDHFKPPIPISKNIQKLSWALQTHAYAVNKDSLDMIIKYTESRKYWIDGIFAEIHSFMNCYATTKCAFVQTTSQSDITPQISRYRFFYEKIVSHLKKILISLKKSESQ